MMKKMIGFSLLALLMVGCAALNQSGAMVSDGVIKNPAMGFFGFSYTIPEGFEVYDSDIKELESYTEIQQLAIRIREQNETYHPSGNETFYESFLMLSENTGFLLITVKHDRLGDADMSWTNGGGSSPRQLMPLYNIRESQPIHLGDSRMEAVLAAGRAYEKKGWYYSRPKDSRMPFSYEACKVSGGNSDGYILMGFSLPEHEHILSIQMKEMIGGFNF